MALPTIHAYFNSSVDTSSENLNVSVPIGAIDSRIDEPSDDVDKSGG